MSEAIAHVENPEVEEMLEGPGLLTSWKPAYDERSHMKQRATVFMQSLRANGNKRRLLLLVLALLLTPPAARAAGIGDILTLVKTITSTIQGAIGGALGGIQTLHNMVNNFRQQIIWPSSELNQARAFVTSTRARYGGVMFQIQAIKNNSATLRNPSRLESLFRNGQSGAIGQFQPLYTSVYGTVPSATDARLLQRNMIDIDDALAEGSLKTTALSDQTTQRMLALADSIEQQSSTAAPGSAITQPTAPLRRVQGATTS